MAERTTRIEAELETYKRSLTEIYELYDKKIEELSLIRRIGDTIRTPLDLETLCRKVLEAVAHEITADHLALLLMDEDRRRLLVRAALDALEEKIEFFSLRKARSVDLRRTAAGKAAASGKPVLSNTAEGCREFIRHFPEGPASLLLLPLVARDRTVGLLALARGEEHPFSDDEVRVLTMISDQAATALDNVSLFNALAAANIGLKESEQQARETSLYLESLLETASDVIFTLNAQGLITYVNQKIEEWEYKKEDLVGQPFGLLDPAPDTGPGLTERLTGQSPEGLEAELLTASGRRRDVLLSPSPISREEGRPSAWLVLARDVTERKQLEKQLFHSEKLASIGILAAGVAHEVGNPLSAISGYTQILLSGGVEEAETREYLSAIESQTARIQRIIEDLLNFSRPSTGTRSDIYLYQALPSILSMLQAQKSFKNIEVVFDLDESLPPVSMDPDHLAQVIINIALNAAQAMPEGGRLSLSASADRETVSIRLADTGPGVTSEAADRIFDPFFTTKPVGQGTGLGLAISHRIVESYHGSITLADEPGPGAVFIVTLPAAPSERT